MAERIEIEVVATDKATSVMKAVTKGTDSATDSAKRLTAATDKQRISITDLYSAVNLASQAFRVLKQGYDFTKEGANIQFTAERFDRLAQSIGTTGDVLLGKMKEATRGTLSDMEAMAAATDILSLGLADTQEQAIRLATVQSGLAMDTNQLVLALTNQTTMRFDQLGVSVKGFEEKVKSLEAAGLSAQEAFTEAFLQQAEEQLLKVGNAADAAAGQYKIFEANTKNATDALKEQAAIAVLPLIVHINELNDAISRERDIMEKTAKSVGMTRDEFVLWGNAQDDMFESADRLINQYQRAEEYGRAWERVLGDITTASDSVVSSNTSIAVSMSAVQAGIQGVITDAVENYEEKLSDLTTKHGELESQLQTLNSTWGTTPDEILKVTNALAENEQAQLDAATAMQEAIDKMIFQQASAGLDAAAQLELARAMGVLDEQSYAAAVATQNLKAQYDAGLISSKEYAASVAKLRDNINSLQDKKVRITVQTVQQTVGNLITQGVPTTIANQYGYAEGGISAGPTSGHLEMLHGTEAVIPLKNGSVPVDVRGNSGGINVTVNYSTMMSLQSDAEIKSRLIPLIIQGAQEAKAQGKI